MPRSRHSAEAGHSEAGFAAFGPQEKGGNVRNILTQHSPTPPTPAPGQASGEDDLIAENMQMVEAYLPLPPSSPS